MPGPDIPFWQDRYLSHQTPWDDGADDPELVARLSNGTLGAQDALVLVPGCGTGRDLMLLASRGTAVTGIGGGPALPLRHQRDARALQLGPLVWPKPRYPRGSEDDHLTVVLTARAG